LSKNTYSHYLDDRKPYEVESSALKVLLIAENFPSKHDNYFYYTGEKQGRKIFFDEIMKVFRITAGSKKDKLKEFKSRGYLLNEATEFGYHDGIIIDRPAWDRKCAELKKSKNLLIILIGKGALGNFQGELTEAGIESQLVSHADCGQQRKFEEQMAPIVNNIY